MLPTSTNRAIQALTTTSHSSKQNVAQSMAIADVKPSATKVKTVSLVVTTTAEFDRHIMARPNQFCSLPFISIDQNHQQIKHRCELTKDHHLHSVEITQSVPAANNPIPPKAKELIQAVELHKPVVELAGFTGKQTTAALYESKEAVQACYDSQQLPLETCTIKDDYHIHSITKPIFIHYDDIPVPAQACGFRRHFAYSSNLVHKSACLPRHWERLENTQKQLYIDDIVDCFNREATYSIIARRHEVQRGNIIALLQENGISLRDVDKEAALAQNYRADRYTTTRPRMRKLAIIPLGKALAPFSKNHQSLDLQTEIPKATTDENTAANTETPSSQAPLLSEILKKPAQPIFLTYQPALLRPVPVTTSSLTLTHSPTPLAKRQKI